MPVVAGNVGPADLIACGTSPLPRSGKLAAYAAITAAPAPIELSCIGAESLVVWINVKTISGAQSVTVSIKFLLADGTKTTAILASTAIAATGLTRLKITPWIAPSANAVAQDFVPEVVEISVALNNAVAVTFDLWATLHA